MQGIIVDIENGFFTVACPSKDEIITYNIKDDCLPQNTGVGAGIDFETEEGLVTKVNVLEDDDLEDLSSQLDDIIDNDPSLPTQVQRFAKLVNIVRRYTNKLTLRSFLAEAILQTEAH